MSFAGREPAVIIGIIVSCILAVLQVLTGADVIRDDTADSLTNVVNSLAGIATFIAPLVAAIIIRQKVTPISQPKLPAGTPVLIDDPSRAPDLPPPDGVVVDRTALP